MNLEIQDLTRGVNNLLKASTVSSLIPHRIELIDVYEKAQLRDVFKVMLDNRIMSLPVYRGKGIKREHYAFIGCIDLVVFILSHVPDDEVKKFNPRSETKEIAKTKVKNVINFANRNDFLSINLTASVQDAVDMLSNKTGVAHTHNHRICVFEHTTSDQTNDITTVSILTQSRVVQRIYENIVSLNYAIGQCSLSDLGFGPKEVISVNLDSQVKDAFLLIAENDINAVAVVDSENRCVGKISNQDIKLAYDHGEAMFDLLSGTVEEYLDLRTSLHNHVLLSFDSTLIETLGYIVENKVHRAFIQDENEKLVGIVSLTDILRLFNNTKTDDDSE
eukprot:TRINITY_DN9643_c0_g1_i1.p1 TRINITY_DN9643_c0_g1~~TRINITY_DN9643_c0_g1_i1.p1  ORF type:complete len:333 (+),score=58.80 TRINITY_DN9643_c0_g1_i1:51-1049(+)